MSVSKAFLFETAQAGLLGRIVVATKDVTIDYDTAAHLLVVKSGKNTILVPDGNIVAMVLA